MASVSIPFLLLGASIGTAVLALAVFAAGVTDKRGRSFATYLALKSALVFTWFVANGTDWLQVDPRMVSVWFQLSMPFAAAYFFLRCFAPGDAPGPLRWMRRSVVAGAVLVLLLYLWDHTLVFSDEGIQPLFLVDALHPLVLAGAAFFLLLKARATTEPGRRRSFLLIAVALALEGLILGTLLGGIAIGYLLTQSGDITFYRSWVELLVLLAYGSSAVFLVTVLPLALYFGRSEVTKPERVRTAIALYAPILLGAVIAALAAVFHVKGLVAFADLLLLAYMGVWYFFLPLLVGYALLRYRLFDLPFRVKITISRGFLYAVYAITFIAATSAAQEYLADRYGLMLGALATGLLLFWVAPLARFANQVAERAMPGVKSIRAMSGEERLDFYREQLMAAWHDGVLDLTERRVLQVSRQRLGITMEEALRVEDEIVRIGRSA